MIVALASCSFLLLRGTAADRSVAAGSPIAVRGETREDGSSICVNFAVLPIRPNLASIETIEDLCGVKLFVLGATGSIEVHYVLEIRCVRRGSDLVCTDYVAVSDDGTAIECRRPHLEGDVLVTGPARLIWGGQALIPVSRRAARRDLFGFLASETKRACPPDFEGVVPSSPLFAFGRGATPGQEQDASVGETGKQSPDLVGASEQEWLTAGLRKSSVLEEEFETDSLGFLRVRNAVVQIPGSVRAQLGDVEQRAVYSLDRVSIATQAHPSRLCPEVPCGRLTIVTFFGLLYLCNDTKGACVSIEQCKCLPKATPRDPSIPQSAIPQSDGALYFELECTCQLK